MARALAALGAVAMAAFGCGVKGAPRPPHAATSPPAAQSPKTEPGAPVQPAPVPPLPDAGTP